MFGLVDNRCRGIECTKHMLAFVLLSRTRSDKRSLMTHNGITNDFREFAACKAFYYAAGRISIKPA